MGFASRQLCGTEVSAHEVSAYELQAGSPETFAAAKQAVNAIKQKLLTGYVKLTRPEDQAGPEASGPASPAGPEDGLEGPDGQAGGHEDNAAAAVLQGLMLVDDADETLLQNASAWLQDMLAPAHVRSQDGEQPPQTDVARQYLEACTSDVYKLQPPEHHEEQVEQQREQQQQHSKQLTDVHELLLTPPSPIDAFVPPELWCKRQHQLLDTDNTCDLCGKTAVTMVSSARNQCSTD